MNIELCIKYILRDRPEYNDWLSQGFSKPWSLQMDGTLSWDESILGIPCPTPDELAAIEPIAIAWEEQEFQDNKSPSLKMMENIYIDFLTNDWTPLLRSKGIIAQDYTVMVDNTDEQQNIVYLLTLRSIDKPSYYNMAGEFERLKSNIVANGGIMSKVVYHA